MKLIKKLPVVYEFGQPKYYAIYECEACGDEIKRLTGRERQKSCGCVKHKPCDKAKKMNFPKNMPKDVYPAWKHKQKPRPWESSTTKHGKI